MTLKVLNEKIEILRRCLHRVSEKKPKNLKALEKDIDSQDIILINLERAVQSCVDMAAHILSEMNIRAPETMADSFSLLEQEGVISQVLASKMKAAVGFRNIAVHEYQEINWGIVYSIITKDIGDFKKFAAAILKWSNRK